MKICPRCSDLYPDDAGFCPLDGTALKANPDPYLGRTIGSRYRLIKKLGSGGMSVVYLARHVMIDRLNAIKILRQDLSLDPSHRERFLREARAVNRINHPNIVEITDFGEADGMAYLVMEYAGGSSLLAAIKKAPLGWERAARIGAQIASALGRAHEAGVIHRDLKPENVILLEGDVDAIKLTDFGIAKILDAPALTFSEQMFGTPGYIAPEVVEGQPADGRSDLFALGVVLHEMTCGSLPWKARGQAEMLLKPLNTPPKSLAEKVPGVPSELDQLVLSMLARKPDDRPHDAFAVERALLALGAAPAPRLSVPLQEPEEKPEPREPLDTLSQKPSDGEDEDDGNDARPFTTANLGRLQTSEMALRWNAALADLENAIARAKRRKKSPEKIARAEELAAHAKNLSASVERASHRVAEIQPRVDRLEAHAREFRQNLGHAIDALSRDRSRERAHIAALRDRADQLELGEAGDAGEKDARLWEIAAIRTEVDRGRLIVDDLSFQIVQLQLRLESKNEIHEREFAAATGELEGAISAVRTLTSELVRTLDEAAGLVSSGGKRAGA